MEPCDQYQVFENISIPTIIAVQLLINSCVNFDLTSFQASLHQYLSFVKIILLQWTSHSGKLDENLKKKKNKKKLDGFLPTGYCV